MNRPTTSPRDSSAGDDSHTITGEEMDTAIAAGTATYLSQVMTGFALHRDTWWIEEIGRWLEVDDSVLLGFLDQHYAAALKMQSLFNKQ